MRIEVTPSAAAKLAEHMPQGSESFIKIVYDTEGCGCAVSGVPQLWRMDEAEPTDAGVACELPVRFVIDPRQEVFFEERLKLDYSPANNGFILKSDSQIYHHALSITDKRRPGRA